VPVVKLDDAYSVHDAAGREDSAHQRCGRSMHLLGPEDKYLLVLRLAQSVARDLGERLDVLPTPADIPDDLAFRGHFPKLGEGVLQHVLEDRAP
jgi:hypothetical protein